MTITQTNRGIKTTITIEPLTIYTSRLIDNHMCKINVNLDGTIEDMITKCERVSKLSNDMYKELSRIHTCLD
jgi:hypothetical protein